MLWCEPWPERTVDQLDRDGGDAADSPPNDPYFPLQYYLNQIYAVAGWDVAKGDSSVIIAIVDTGVDFNHLDLAGAMWQNHTEAVGRPGADDDGNGFVDDVYGWDFVDDDSDPRPVANDQHGTHVGGTAGAVLDNGIGIVGVGAGCRLMDVRIGDDHGVTNGFEGLIYAAAMGADVINLSWGGESPSQAERIAVDWAVAQGSLVIAAAGNVEPGQFYDHYPAAYSGSVAVTSVNDRDVKSSFGNCGAWVDISAPGEQIYSTFPSGGYGYKMGTSMASPMVAGAAGLLKSLHPEFTPDRLRAQLLASVDPIDDVNPQYAGLVGKGRLNVYRLLTDRKSQYCISHIALDDSAEGNGDGVVNSGETLLLSLTITNLLLQPQDVSLFVRPVGPYSFADSQMVELGRLAPGESATNTTPFRVRTSGRTPAGFAVKFLADIFTGARRLETLPFEIEVNPHHYDLISPQVQVTVSDFGAIGYLDYLFSREVGVGFRAPGDGISGLFHGSLMLGAEGVGVSDCAYGDSLRRRYDFLPEEDGFRVTRSGAELTAEARFTDAGAEHPLGLIIHQTLHQFSTDSHSFVVLDYLLNRSDFGASYDSISVGLLLDWDIVQADENRAYWDLSTNAGWMEYSKSGKSFGAALIGQPAGFQCILNSWEIDYWGDAKKLNVMGRGFAESQRTSKGDFAQVIGSAPLALEVGDSVEVIFILAGGESSAEYLASIETGRSLWQGRTFRSATPTLPRVLAIASVYPQPFNAETMVESVIPNAGGGALMLFDPLGREVFRKEFWFPSAGMHKFRLSAANLAAGSYLLNLQQGGETACRQVIILK